VGRGVIGMGHYWVDLRAGRVRRAERDWMVEAMQREGSLRGLREEEVVRRLMTPMTIPCRKHR